MSYRFREFEIPDRMFPSIEGYIQRRLKAGHFLTAIITNNLSEAVARADDDNLRNLPAFVAYFYNEAPASCWGSPENMLAWLRSGPETP